MKLSIVIRKKDPKICLLDNIIKFIDNRQTIQLLARNGIHNTNKMLDCIKIILMSMYFEYTISDMLRELNGNKKLQKHYNITNTFTEQEFYAFF